jgi:hypothetical protein
VLDQDLSEAIDHIGTVSSKKTRAQIHGIQRDFSAVLGGFPQVGGVGFRILFNKVNRINNNLNAVARSKDPLGKQRTKTRARLELARQAANVIAGEDGLGSGVTTKFKDIADALEQAISSLDKGTPKLRTFLKTIQTVRMTFLDALDAFPAVQGASFGQLFGGLSILNKLIHQALAVHATNPKFAERVTEDLTGARGLEQRLQGQLNGANRP